MPVLRVNRSGRHGWRMYVWALYRKTDDTTGKLYVLCHWCGARMMKKEMTIDHVLPMADGGTHALDNMVPACCKCNQERSFAWQKEFNEKYGGPNPKERFMTSQVPTEHRTDHVHGMNLRNREFDEIKKKLSDG